MCTSCVRAPAAPAGYHITGVCRQRSHGHCKALGRLLQIAFGIYSSSAAQAEAGSGGGEESVVPCRPLPSPGQRTPPPCCLPPVAIVDRGCSAPTKRHPHPRCAHPATAARMLWRRQGAGTLFLDQGVLYTVTISPPPPPPSRLRWAACSPCHLLQVAKRALHRPCRAARQRQSEAACSMIP